jgi:cellulose/xylan binding protein with CBM9 domain
MARRTGRWLGLGALLLIGCPRPAPDSRPQGGGAAEFPVPRIPFAPERYVCERAEEPPVIDGALTEEAWRRARWTSDFVDIEGPGEPRPRFRTRAKMLWDDRYFYVAAELEEPEIWATLRERDAVIFHDNDFELFIDPDGDTHAYYELELNALATVWDLLLIRPYRDGGPAVNGWEIRGLEARVAIDGTLDQPGDRDRGWSVELALPWAALKECAPDGAPPRPGAQWRVNFSRVEWRVETRDGRHTKSGAPEENWVWSPQGLVDMHYPEMWGFVQFSSAPAGAATDPFRVDPEEQVRWALRQVYYQQRRFFARHGRFAPDIAALGLDLGGIHVEIEPTSTRYQARARRTAEAPLWQIDQEGRIWR